MLLFRMLSTCPPLPGVTCRLIAQASPGAGKPGGGDSPDANHVESCQDAHQTGAILTAHHGGAAHQVCGPAGACGGSHPAVAEPAAVDLQSNGMSQAFEMCTDRGQELPLTVPPLLSWFASRQAPPACQKTALKQQILWRR